LVTRANSYTEVTPSGTGIRIIGNGSGPRVHRKLQVADGVTCEIYRRATRYITVSGAQLNGCDALADLDPVVKKF
jgi:primase-polymerase (primpol)-like protein